MNIITISREFGSGGRELGRRLAAKLGYDYYDKEIIAAIAQNKGMDENYVKNALIDQTIPRDAIKAFLLGCKPWCDLEDNAISYYNAF